MTTQTLIKHEGIEWWTSFHNHKDYNLIIRTKNGYGAKIHILKDGMKTKTFRYSFATPQHMLERAIDWINNIKEIPCVK